MRNESKLKESSMGGIETKSSTKLMMEGKQKQSRTLSIGNIAVGPPNASGGANNSSYTG